MLVNQNMVSENVCCKYFKGKGSQKYTWILFISIWKTEHFEANCMEIGYLLLKLLRFYVFKMAVNGGRRFEINMKVQNYEIQLISQKHAALLLLHLQSLFIM